MDAILSCQGLTKLYGQKAALVDFTYDFPKGRIVGLLGPNGSGKTTLLKLAAGLLTATRGSIRVCGLEPGTETKSAFPSCRSVAACLLGCVCARH